MIPSRLSLRVALVGLAVLAAGLVGGCDKTPPLPQFIAAEVPRPQWPAECVAANPPEPAPSAAVRQSGLDDDAAARATRQALLWGRDLGHLRLVCRAWLSAYVAERWPTPASQLDGKPARLAAAE